MLMYALIYDNKIHHLECNNKRFDLSLKIIV